MCIFTWKVCVCVCVCVCMYVCVCVWMCTYQRETSAEVCVYVWVWAWNCVSARTRKRCLCQVVNLLLPSTTIHSFSRAVKKQYFSMNLCVCVCVCVHLWNSRMCAQFNMYKHKHAQILNTKTNICTYPPTHSAHIRRKQTCAPIHPLIHMRNAHIRRKQTQTLRILLRKKQNPDYWIKLTGLPLGTYTRISEPSSVLVCCVIMYVSLYLQRASVTRTKEVSLN
jgi:hypothetical protein